MNEAAGYLLRQFDTAWKLAEYHLAGLTTDECLWRPAPQGPHVVQAAEGYWQADWPEHEGYDLGPPSIAWLTWHMAYWWSTALDHARGSGTLAREDVKWPGTADAMIQWLQRLHGEWRSLVENLHDDDLRSRKRSRWPMQDRPFGDVVGWVNVELTKNAAELGYVRFLYAVRVGAVLRRSEGGLT